MKLRAQQRKQPIKRQSREEKENLASFTPDRERLSRIDKQFPKSRTKKTSNPMRKQGSAQNRHLSGEEM